MYRHTIKLNGALDPEIQRNMRAFDYEDVPSLELRREDKDADRHHVISVWAKRSCVGRIPKFHSELLASFMDDGNDVKATYVGKATDPFHDAVVWKVAIEVS